MTRVFVSLFICLSLFGCQTTGTVLRKYYEPARSHQTSADRALRLQGNVYDDADFCADILTPKGDTVKLFLPQATWRHVSRGNRLKLRRMHKYDIWNKNP